MFFSSLIPFIWKGFFEVSNVDVLSPANCWEIVFSTLMFASQNRSRAICESIEFDQ